MMPSFHLHRRRYNPTFLSNGGASKAGDVGYVPVAMGHYLENTGSVPLRFLETFKSPYFVDFSLDTWMALTPPELVEAHLNLDRQVMDALRKTKALVVPK